MILFPSSHSLKQKWIPLCSCPPIGQQTSSLFPCLPAAIRLWMRYEKGGLKQDALAAKRVTSM